MLTLSNLKKALLVVLPTAVSLAIFFVFIYQPKLSTYKDKVRELKAINGFYNKQNDTLLKRINYIQKDMAKMDEIILTLYSENATLQSNLDSLDRKIHSIKRKYEKSRIADSFNHSDIKSYFAELK